MREAIQVSTTFAGEDDAIKLGHNLVVSGLAACAQVQGPITSSYRWEGKVEQSCEWLLTVKTLRDRFDAVAAAIVKEHAYALPEIIAVPIVAGSAEYLKWIDDNVTLPE